MQLGAQVVRLGGMHVAGRTQGLKAPPGTQQEGLGGAGGGGQRAGAGTGEGSGGNRRVQAASGLTMKLWWW